MSPAGQGGRATTPRLSVVSPGLREPVPSGARGAAPGARGKPAARDDVRTPVQITPAVVSAEQSASDAFTTAGLIPGRVDFRNFSYPGFNDTVRRA